MSIDESVSFHEAFITILSGLGAISGIFYFAWVVPGTIFVAVFGLIYLRFLCRIPTDLARGLVVSGIVFLTGALGLEMIDGWIAANYGEDTAIYIIGYCLEDIFEIIGVLMFVNVTSAHLVEVLGNLEQPVKLQNKASMSTVQERGLKPHLEGKLTA